MPEDTNSIVGIISNKILWTAFAIAIAWIIAQAVMYWLSSRKLRGPEPFFLRVLAILGAGSLIISPLTFSLSLKREVSDALGSGVRVIVDMGIADYSMVVVGVVATMAVILSFAHRRDRQKHMASIVIQKIDKWMLITDDQRKSFDDLI